MKTFFIGLLTATGVALVVILALQQVEMSVANAYSTENVRLL